MSWHRWHIRASHSSGWGIARRKSPISHIRRQALPEGFIYKRAEKLSRGRRHISLVLVGYQRMQIHYKKIPSGTQWRSGETRQWNEKRRWGGGARYKTKVDVEPAHHYGFTENLLHLISCPRVFQFEHKTPPGEFRQWAREETSEGKRRGRKMRA